ncbi:MAG: riboflavin biosynthesis protein RibF [bacterium]|nr:riboflavin biosynthesis protein RibF [bacterium]
MRTSQDNIKNLSGITLILGFFDGIHVGHRKVISSAVEYANKYNTKTLLLTFTKSPAEYFGKNFEYICDREVNYEIIRNLGVNCICDCEFDTLAKTSAEEYLKQICHEYSPRAIFTGYNYTFGVNKSGNTKMLFDYAKKLNYEYYEIEKIFCCNKEVSSTNIKFFLKSGEIEQANLMLTEPFKLKSKVIKGEQLGKTLGFPTANMLYPKDIVKLPHGVYKTKVSGMPAVLNWGIKPTFGNNNEILEVHILNYTEDLYGQELCVEFEKKLRDELKFNTVNDLKSQINKDIEECLK